MLTVLLVTSGEDRVSLFLAGTVGDCTMSSAEAISPLAGGGGTDGGELETTGANFLGEAATTALCGAA